MNEIEQGREIRSYLLEACKRVYNSDDISLCWLYFSFSCDINTMAKTWVLLNLVEELF